MRTTTMNEMSKIVKILAINDTRQYEEIEDTFKPIPGSGDINYCERCGKAHEVHAIVLLESGHQAVVGTTCMNAESTEMITKIKAGTSTAKTLKRLQSQLDAFKVEWEIFQAAWECVNGLELPEPEYTYATPACRRDKTPVPIIRYGDSHGAWLNGATDFNIPKDTLNERLRCAQSGWKRDQFKRLYPGMDYWLYDRRPDLEKRIENAKQRLANIIEG